MGNWKLEIAKMVIYMAFPVTSFYVYHQVGTADNWTMSCHVSTID